MPSCLAKRYKTTCGKHQPHFIGAVDAVPKYNEIVDEVFTRIGKDRLGYITDDFDIRVLVSQQSPDIAQGVDISGAGVVF